MDLRNPPTFAINGVVVDVAEGTVRDRKGHEVPLRPQAFILLTYLLENPERLVTKDELMKAIWPGVFVTDDSLVQCVRDIRRAIGDKSQSVLKAVPKRGYRLTASAGSARVVARRVWPAAIGALALLVLAVAGIAWRFSGAPTEDHPLDTRPVVVVLPFTSIRGDRDGLGVGLCKDFVSDLSRSREFQIVIRDPSYSYVAKLTDALQVDFVVRGAVDRDGGRLRITAQLIEATTGKLLWSEHWDRPDRDVPAVRAEISGLISNRLSGNAGLIQQAGRTAAHQKPPDDLTAYELYLLGTEKLEQIKRADVKEAIGLLNRSAELEPGLARAWVELYFAHDIMAEFGVDPEHNRGAAAEAAERAVELSPSDAKAHAVLGLSLRYENDFVRTRSELETALTLAPDAYEIQTVYAGGASSFGQARRGAEMVDQLVRLEPNFPTWTARQFSRAYFMAGRYDGSLEMMEQIQPDNYTPILWAMRPAALAAAGRIEEARAWVARAVEAVPQLSIELMANEPGYSDAEHRLLINTMRLAGFPRCAEPELLPKLAKPQRLPECQ